ncbi:uncharacterized protein LOC110854547 isoform X2 [Folsomia candida]|uniref:uncharacterized protein LOC110854547 isoform X2 n=1 Tax=Folsomia candida TaxID=158441 RepID=UPI001604C54C|nr:uncharacterized protein LOC110854547 isoform X2 [Folsomia candida]
MCILWNNLCCAIQIHSQDLGPDDTYTFCGKGRQDNSACQGFCVHNQTICSPIVGICSCAAPATRLKTLSSNYNCKPARPRSRCHNGCKTYAMITPRFRRGETKICDSKTMNKRMCFCLPKV